MNTSDFGLVIGLMATAQEGSAPAAPPTQGAPRVPGTSSATGAVQPGATGPVGPAPSSNPFSMIWILMLFLVVMVVMTSMTGRREKKRRAALMSALKKGDRVQTLGGIIGTIVELHDTEAVLRVDEVSNTRIRFARSAIQGVLREGKAAPGSGGSEVESKPHAQASTV